MDNSDKFIQEIPEKIHSVTNGVSGKEYDSLLGLGWAVGVRYKDVIVNHYGDYPSLFLIGGRQSGKTTYGRWIRRCFGMRTDGNTIAAQSKIDYHCQLPYWLDDYHSNQKINKTSEKGRPMIIAGEHKPQNQEIMSHCIFINFSENKKTDNKELFNKTQKDSLKFETFIAWITVNKNPEKEKRLIDNIAKREKEFLSNGVNKSTARNYAICLESYLLIFEYCHDEFCEYISNKL
ncbi:MAG: hypothetical protein GY870_11280 [archaeon]|nr:hypothetical protein [archaeon]